MCKLQYYYGHPISTSLLAETFSSKTYLHGHDGSPPGQRWQPLSPSRGTPFGVPEVHKVCPRERVKGGLALVIAQTGQLRTALDVEVD